ncbi:DUF5085 family protein [Streptococcus acidominimus]|uniref:DUF5085 family protein n=1 Tax=Streptococcus acidominimus TaxID=1326 RepID=UPI001D1626DD|nr:DUF5085 family protein [Streptococcus acidominimus]
MKLGAENVVRQRKTFHINEMKKELTLFITSVLDAGGHPSGPLFYSLNEIPYDGVMKIELFLPIDEEYLDIKDLGFSSYFEIGHIIKTTVTHDFENLTQDAYISLLETLEMNDLPQRTPFYHIFDPTNGGRVTILLGYAY